MKLIGYDETILVVDDDPNVLSMIQAALEAEGYRVLVASNGADALDVAADYAMRIHLIVTDVRMPEMGGRQLIEVVRRWYPSLRVLVVSGYADSKDNLADLEWTPTAFLAKPFTPEQLAAAVRALLDQPKHPRERRWPEWRS